MRFDTSMKIIGFMTGKAVEFDKKELTSLKAHFPIFAKHGMKDFLMLLTGGDETLTMQFLSSAKFEEGLIATKEIQTNEKEEKEEEEKYEKKEPQITTKKQQALYQIFDVLIRLENPELDDQKIEKIVSDISQNFSVLLSNQKDIGNSLKHYFKRFVNEGSNHPILDLCKFKFPGTEAYSDFWFEVLCKYGPRFAKKIFPYAKEFEEYCTLYQIKPPLNRNELEKLVLKAFYERADEDLEFAKECLKHKIPDNAFNLALDIFSNQAKKGDELPDVQVDGKSIGLKRFILKKLACHDKRGFILGKYTDCCQHIAHEMGKDASIAGMTSQYSGFFTIYKIPQKGGEPEIIAQSWAWLSKKGELVFDSWEFRREQDQPMLVPFMAEFIKNLPQNIQGVYIGASGGTPKDLPYTLVTENLPEPMEPTGFRDSKLAQWCVMSPELKKELEYTSFV